MPSGMRAVAASSGSGPAMAASSVAAPRTSRAIGPAVSCDSASGMMPLRLTSPSVGLMPTIPLIDDGQMIEPSVSVPTASGTRPVATATAEPLEDPQGLRAGSIAWRAARVS